MKVTHDGIFISIIGALFAALLIVFLFFPRSKVSNLERRELAEFPEFSFDKLKDGTFTEELSLWFSDTEPFRDVFMEANHKFKKGLSLHRGGEEGDVTFHQATGAVPGADMPDVDGRDFGDFNGNNADANAKIGSAGIVVTGPKGKVRALMVFGGADKGSSPFAKSLNYIHRQLGPNVNVYSMIIPTAIEFYCPDKVKSRTRSQAACMRNIYSQLDPAVHVVDAYSGLAAHVDEPIYLRTDHHWAPLGAYYAAEQLARTAKVPFRNIKDYNVGVTHNFVGTMYGYSEDISVKESPEDFVYYMPKDKGYTTWFTDYVTDRDFHVVGERNPARGAFFIPHKDGSGAAYTTMLGSDMRLAKVITGTKSNRKLLIIKDSFGNAVPGFMFGSFEEVHVIDFRYFPHSLKKYVADNGITDVVVCVNIFNAYSGGVAEKLRRLVGGAGFQKPSAHPAESPAATPADKKEQPAATPQPAEAPEPPAIPESPAPPAKSENPIIEPNL
ncbi:MAG: DHHW family protein [Clostridium sp.]|nr:DHHW family protein [Prevotella sp.]MCM1429018.1 DHHW family protein [Clostridium sp.]MCM1475451.1 DHHW family protein [Muribaculaceae bacterium]